MNLGSDVQKASVVLIVSVHSGDHSHAKCVGTAGQGGSNRLKRGDRQCVSDDGQFIAPQAGSRKAIGRSLRVAEDRVAPAEGDGLCSKLRWSHNIADLAMAANNDRRARKPSSGDQS